MLEFHALSLIRNSRRLRLRSSSSFFLGEPILSSSSLNWVPGRQVWARARPISRDNHNWMRRTQLVSVRSVITLRFFWTQFRTKPGSRRQNWNWIKSEATNEIKITISSWLIFQWCNWSSNSSSICNLTLFSITFNPIRKKLFLRLFCYFSLTYFLDYN